MGLVLILGFLVEGIANMSRVTWFWLKALERNSGGSSGLEKASTHHDAAAG
jgi:hypothetical protein